MNLTIIIPVYNVENYIKDCLDSVYDGELKDFEVLCIDDRGTDNSIDIIKKYIEINKINNLRIIRHEDNKGLSEARNTGMSQAKGQYICFLDSDDMIETNGLNKLLEKAMLNNLDIVEGKIREVFETDKRKEKCQNQRNDSIVMTGDDYFYQCCKKKVYFTMAWLRIFKTEYLRKGYFFEPGLKFEDEDFSPKVIINADRVQYYDIEFYIYRRREESITTTMTKNNKWVESYLKIISNLLEFAKTIEGKKSYNVLKDRIGNIALSLLKNPIAYGTSEENLNEIIMLIKDKKIYKIPIESKNIFIKAQGIIMKYPTLFIKLYSKKEGE